MKALVGAFNQEKALVGAFSVIVQPVVEPMEHYTVDCDLGPEHFKEGTTLNSPHCQEFMVWRIFSVVLIFLSPLMDEFTL